MTLQQLLLAPHRTGLGLKANSAVGKYALILSDLLALLLAAVLANTVHLLRPGIEAAGALGLWTEPMGRDRLQILVPLFALAIAWFWLAGHYTRRRPFWSELSEILRVIVMLAAIDAASLYLARLPFSRFWFLGAWLGAIAFIPVLRFLTKTALLRLGIWQRPAIVLGSGPNAIDAAAALESERLMGLKVIAFAIDASTTSSGKNSITTQGRPIPVTTFHSMEPFILRGFGNTTLVVALEQGEFERDAQLISRLHRFCDDVRVVPPLRGLPLYGSQIHYYFRHELFFLHLGNNLGRRGPRTLKRAFDICGAAFLLTICLPLFAYLAIRIREDGDPILFVQQRIGRNAAPFDCLKLRSMVTNAEAVLDELLSSDTSALAEWERDHKLKNDPRVTPVGRFLRKYSLDELPQLWNVLKGEMSLVGPRPIINSELERYGEDADYYLQVKPGMTGLWQISGRNDIDYAERVFLDAWYAKNWSLWLDIVIFFKTVGVVMRSDGAY